MPDTINRMLDTINIVTVHSHYRKASCAAKVTQYGNDYTLDNDQTVNYLLNHYSAGYINFSNLSKSTGLMPPGVKALLPNLVVFERPPVYQNIFYIPKVVTQEMSDQHLVYRIALPWQLYIALYNSDYYLHNVYMYFMDAPLTSLDQNLYAPAIPNFYANGQLCRPNFSLMDDVERYSKDVSGVISAAFDWVWNNGTNHDLTESMLLLPKFTKDISSTVFGLFDEAKLYFDPSCCSGYKLTVDQVKTAFSSWEKVNIKDILNYKWVVPSSTLHHSDTMAYIQMVQQTEAYCDNIQDWLFSEYYDECEEDIISRLENLDYDVDRYITFLISNNYISPPLPQNNDFSYKKILHSICMQYDLLKKKTVNILYDIKKITEILSSDS